jgi:galactitol-specific phosphotransferase system IIC component
VRSPRGQALAEYLTAAVAFAAIWVMFDTSEHGLGRALQQLMSFYSFSLSLPW